LPKTLCYYVSGHTADGYVNFLSSNVKHMKIVTITHPSYTLKTMFLQEIKKYYEMNYDIEIICSAISKNFIDGIIIREINLAIIANDLITSDLHIHKEISLENTFKIEQNFNEKKETIKAYIQTCFRELRKGLKIHDDLESIYIQEMDFSKANMLIENTIEQLLDNVPVKERQPHIYRRLFGTNTIEGSINIVPHLIRTVSKRYYIKGRAGTGKSVFMNKIADACLQKGYDIEYYHCSLEPNSVDMILVRTLDFCMFDSTDPHEFFPEHKHDKVIDLYEAAVTPGTDEKYAENIKEITQAYKAYMKKGINSLKKAGDILRAIENEYFAYIDTEKLKQYCKNITKQLA